MRRARRGRPVDRLQGIVATMKACSLGGLRWACNNPESTRSLGCEERLGKRCSYMELVSLWLAVSHDRRLIFPCRHSLQLIL